MPSYYAPQLQADSKILYLEGEEHHHLHRVKRKQAGETILLNSGTGIMAEALILTCDKQNCKLQIQSAITHGMSQARFAIAFALLKGHHDELAVEKCTELGAAEFFPFTSDYSVRNPGKNTISRFQKICLSAIKQCDNPYLPVVHEQQDLASTIERILARAYLPVLCSEREKNLWMKDLDISRNVCFIIGPEGGFSEAEFELMQGLTGISLSPLISRAETAAITAAAQFVGIQADRGQNSL